MDWFLYDRDLLYERVNGLIYWLDVILFVILLGEGLICINNTNEII